MRIVAISDTHTYHSKVVLPPGDVLVFAGDMSACGEATDIRDFDRWLLKLPFRHKIVIAGNHDLNFEDKPKKRWITNGTYLFDRSVVIDGIKFYGSPWQPWFYNWAFNLPVNGEELERVWAKIPEDTDVLVTHSPPFKILDPDRDGNPVGCPKLLQRVKAVRPKVHIFGHLHSGYGQVVKNGTIFVNASVCTEQYQPVNAPIVIDL